MRLPLLLLALTIAGSFAFHAYRAEHPSSYQSADEASYGKLATDIVGRHSYGDPTMKDALHWPPGAPFLFAAAYKLSPSKDSVKSHDIPAAYWAQALVSLGTLLAAFGLAWALAGIWAGVLAAALVGFYPPLILMTGEQVSEPLGAFFLTAAFCALAWAAKERARGPIFKFVGVGVLFGLAVLTRADLLLVPVFVAVLWVIWTRRREWKLALALLAGTALVMAPWVIYASHRAGKFVPVTRGSSPPLFVGTYLPGHGHTVGMKRALEADVKRFAPQYRDTAAFNIPADVYMEMIAARHPGVPRDTAIGREARHNLRKYALGDPPAFAWMMLGKVQRMWTRYARGGARHTSPWIRGWHIVLVIACFAGLLAGLIRRRVLLLACVLVALLYSTALHTLVVSQARYNLPLMPSLVAAGLAGWFLWRRRARTGEDQMPEPTAEPIPA